MTETIAHTDGHAPPPIPPKPHTDAAAVKAMPRLSRTHTSGRSDIQDTVHKILAAVGGSPATG